MKIIVILALALSVLVVASPASAITKPQAFAKSKTCLLKRAHAGFVGRRGDGGGYATWHGRGSTFWTYKTWFGQVASVTVYFAGRPGLRPGTKALVRECLQRPIL